MAEQKTNYWPQSIAALLFAAALLIVWTVIQTSTMPVHEENNFMSKYQNVDLNADEILKQNKAFFQEYGIAITSPFEEVAMENAMYKKRNRTTRRIDPSQPLRLQVDAKDKKIKQASMQVLLSRPTTTASDRQLEVKQVKSDTFEIDLSGHTRPGRWQLVVKADVSKKTGYKNFDLWIDE